ncbi:MAG: P1 family peptidase [Hyphomonadaceae bacterium]
MAKPGPRNTIADVGGLLVGCAEDAAVRTGVTVLLPEARATAAVEVLGGGPGTRETDALAPQNLVDAVDAIVLSGGSVYGLGAADAVVAALGARGRGYVLRQGAPAAPVVPAAILFDLGNGGDKSWGETPPYARLGRAALDAVSAEVPLGSRGAGYGAMAGQLQGGQGSASAVTEDGFTVAALAAVNCFGSATAPGGRAFWAWALEQGGEFGSVGAPKGPLGDLEDWGGAKADPAGRNSTTLCVAATDAVLSKAQAKRFAQMAAAGLARAIRPVFAPFDGDVVFALATGAKALPDPAALHLARLGALAADCVARAVARGVYAAGRWPSAQTRVWRDLV